MPGIISWCIVAVALTGTVLNIKQSRWGFFLWMISNTGLFVNNILIGEYAQAAMFLAYLGLAIWGFFSWGKSEKPELEKETVSE